MQYQLVSNNPFGVLTAIVAPAILTNACSVLSLGTSNRIGRVVDRTRIVTADIVASVKGSPEYVEWTSQLRTLEIRVHMLLRALRLIYGALGLFASTALISVTGSVASFYGERFLFQLGAALAIGAGSCAVIGLAYGCYLMIKETRLAVKSLGEEAAMRIRLSDTSKTD